MDFEKTVFVGNLPFNISEQAFRDHFSSIGKIENIRLIKDKENHQGIGIGYVHYSKKEGKLLVMQI